MEENLKFQDHLQKYLSKLLTNDGQWAFNFFQNCLCFLSEVVLFFLFRMSHAIRIDVTFPLQLHIPHAPRANDGIGTYPC